MSDHHEGTRADRQTMDHSEEWREHCEETGEDPDCMDGFMDFSRDLLADLYGEGDDEDDAD